jgi:CheY-like chemotaxis protein
LIPPKRRGLRGTFRPKTFVDEGCGRGLRDRGQEISVANEKRNIENRADDYVVKPFSPRELVARTKAVLMRGRLVT